ncbi:MAG: AbrB/MazE/SpoVT family DNA-binding domain-containing protein [Ruminococcaceae bacterium]|nr:AbrB/MazE/SpoVT family DNA-binding domain-containing protein [Oscillospiraceae bacterium]
MKAVGSVRNIDALGRIVIPKDIRNRLEIEEGDSLEMFLDDNTIVIRKYNPSCILCGSAKDIVTFRGKNFCPNCVKEMSTKLL